MSATLIAVRLLRPKVASPPALPPIFVQDWSWLRRRHKLTDVQRAVLILFGQPLPVDFNQRYAGGRGSYRIFNDAEYRLFRSNVAPPETTDTPYATATSLPTTPGDTFADGTWYISVSYFNGVLDSGFLPLNDRGETYIRLDISGGVVVERPPQGPLGWTLQQLAGGVVRIAAMYAEEGTLRADTWAIAYTTDGSTPAEDTPDVTQDIDSAGLAILEYDLPAQVDGTVIKVRLQTLRGSTYSEGSEVQTITIDTTAASAVLGWETWRGFLPEQ